MGKSLNYFFPDKAEKKAEKFEVVASKRFKDEEGNYIPWSFRLFSAKEINDIQKASVRTTNTNGKIQASTDMDYLKIRAILELSLIHI